MALKPTNKAELICRWRATAAEIRRAILEFPDLDQPTKQLAELMADSITACADKLESFSAT